MSTLIIAEIEDDVFPFTMFIFLAAIVLFVIIVYTIWCVIQHYKFKTSMDNERSAYHNEVTAEEGKY